MRRTIAAIGSLTVLAAAASCSNSPARSTTDSHPAPTRSSNLVLSAFARTTAAGTAKFTQRTELRSSRSKTVLTTTSTGKVDFGHGTGQLVGSLLGAKGTVTIVFAHDTIYEKLPAASARAMHVHTPWASFSARSVTGSDASSDPLRFLDSLQGVTDGIHTVGQERIGGVATTHYKATIDLARAASAAGGAAKYVTGLEQVAKSKTLPTDVWIDRKGQLRRQVLSLRLTGKGQDGKPVTLVRKNTIDLSDYGTPVRVTIPPAGQTTDITSRMTASQ